MSMSSGQARSIAERAHMGQTDRNGAPYIDHVERVADAVYRGLTHTDDRAQDNDALVAVAYLHDVLEDTTVSMAALRDVGLDLAQEIALRALTRRGVKHPEYSETYAEYLDRVVLCPMARRIKLHDLHDNMDPARVAAAGTYGLVRRYTAAYKKLMAAELGARK